MTEWEKTLIAPTTTVMEAINVIDKAGLRVAFVVDTERKLLGIVTDVEVRRAILAKVALDAPVADIMNAKPRAAHPGYDTQQVLQEMRTHHVGHLPVLNSDHQVIDLLLLDDLIAPEKIDNQVVLMAGGLGTRLRPLTENCPKPLLKIGGKPILENIIDNFTASGFGHFYISINYKGDMIRKYFGDGAKFGAKIEYVEEKKRLGTVGALKLLPARPDKPFIVMNADLLTTVDFQHLLNYHITHQVAATMCVREYDIQVPYGVATIEDSFITQLDEKPVHKFFVNAGIYVLNPEVIDLIPDDEYFDITVLFDKLLAKKQKIASFPLREYWMDIGRLDDFAHADKQYDEVFR